MKAIELHSKTDKDGRVLIDHDTGFENKKIRVLILVDESDNSELNDKNWLEDVVKSPSFDFLKDEDQDIYTLNDGEPIED
ncbi:hypothetical protein [Rhodohalobacter sp.]|uniref:hypothetical protein n=1 Tax=Rhodohalobacter sp. TaxID=1974210 RepID=UPI002ACE0C12|nr:hypothetical protein [Rhodohalobacter sp.]